MVTRAKTSDSEKLSEIAYFSKKYWGYSDELMNLWKDDLRIDAHDISKSHVFKIGDDKKIFGWISYSIDNDKTLEVDHFWILPDFIGMGFGQQLFFSSLKLIQEDFNKIKVVADPNAIKFYEKLGFEFSHEVVT